MKILVTGKYDPGYNRTLVLLKGLELNGVELIKMPYETWSPSIAEQVKVMSASVDYILLPSFTHYSLTEIKRVSQAPVIFDPLISKYMSKVLDYKRVSRFNPRSIKILLKDRFLFRKADFLLADTECHKCYFSEKLRVPKDKIIVVPVGVDTDEFTLQEDHNANAQLKPSHFNVGFYGNFIPLQGTPTIAKAAAISQQHSYIHWELVGDGFDFEKVKNYVEQQTLQNFSLPGRVDYDKLNETIARYDICLGIFGNTLKTDVVIPNKIYHYAACGKCIISKDTPAIHEAFEHKKNIILVDGSAESLVEAILWCHKNPNEIKRIGLAARDLMREHYDAQHIGRRLLAGLGSTN